MSVFFLLPQITDDMLGFGSVLKGKGAATLHVEAASGQRLGVIWTDGRWETCEIK